ncbi:MAG: hypothetical protein WDW38_008404 [Sanguina aurantia]
MKGALRCLTSSRNIFNLPGAFSPHCTPLQHSLQTSSQQLVARTLRSVQLRASSGEVGPKKPKRGAKPPPETISNNGAPVSLASRGDDMLEEHDEDQDQFLPGPRTLAPEVF